MYEGFTERDRKVLQAIIRDYIQTAQPVGSRIISKKYQMGLSPATIRNVMADLEEMGFLLQPHTSAGRVPTDRAYRFYVDTILNLRRLTPEERAQIETSLIPEEVQDVNEIMKRASHLLSLLSRQTGVVLAPRFGSKIFKHIEFITMREKRILVIIVSQTGEVQNKIIEADEEISQDELDRYSKYLTEIMGGLSLAEAKNRIMEELKNEKVLFDKLMFRALQLSQKALEDEGEGNLYIDGKTNIMQSPEFADMEKIQSLLQTFEEKTKIVKLLDKALSVQGIQIFIGAENELNEMVNCSVVTAPYSRENYTLGTLGVIGPTRMDYSSIIPIVDYTARILGRILENID
ncbi:MAG TPA: heat-inducible transcriptional repressor HrcA [Thermodesulfobacteriota bacterium]|nr:heat-inducible transcriptional repressor HrcA [Thermodesulfobacteriota bacterium]